MSIDPVSSPQATEPIEIVKASEKKQPRELKSPCTNTAHYIDFPPEKLANELALKHVISAEGVYLKTEGPAKDLHFEQIDKINKLKSKAFVVHIHRTNESFTLTVSEILKVIGNEHYIVGSEAFYILGKKWILEFLQQYVEYVDPILLEQFEHESSDFDFRSPIGAEGNPRQLAEKILKMIAAKSKSKKTSATLCHLLREKSEHPSLLAYHPFFHLEEGAIVEDSFLISFEEKTSGIKESLDFNISSKYAGNMLSTQDISIDISGAKPVLSGKYQQAIIDRILKQYRFSRITAKAWARSIVLNSESNSHKASIPALLYKKIKDFCDAYDNVESGLITLLESYIDKHFKKDPNAAVAMAFNASESLIRNNFDAEDLTNFWKKIKERIGKEEDRLHPFYKAILNASSTYSFEDVLIAVQLAKFIELNFEMAVGRTLSGNCDYVVTHDRRTYATCKIAGFSLLIPLEPFNTLQILLTKLEKGNINKISFVLKTFLKQKLLKSVSGNILADNASKFSEQMDGIVACSLKLVEHKETLYKFLGYKLLYVCCQLRPSTELFEKLLQKMILIAPEIGHDQIKQMVPLFFKYAPAQELREKCRGLEKDPPQSIYISYLKILAVYYPDLLISELKLHPEEIRKHKEIIKLLLESLKNFHKEPKKGFFTELSEAVKSAFGKEDIEIQTSFAEAIKALIGSKNKFAAMMLYSVTKANLFTNSKDLAALWALTIDSIAKTHSDDSEKMILLAFHYKIFPRNKISFNLGIETLKCLDNLLKSPSRRSVNAAIAFLRCVLCNVTSVQEYMYVNLMRRVEEISKNSESELARLRESLNKLLDEIPKYYEGKNEFHQKFTGLFNQIIKEDAKEAVQIISSYHLQNIFLQMHAGDEYLGHINSCLEVLNKEHNEDLSPLLELPFRKLIIDEKCPNGAQTIGFIRYLVAFLHNQDEALHHKSLLEHLNGSNKYLLLEVLITFKEVVLIGKFLECLYRFDGSLSLNSKYYFECFRLMLQSPFNTPAFDLYIKLPFPDDPKGIDEFVLLSQEVIDTLFESGQRELLILCFSKYLNFLTHHALHNDQKIIDKLLSWVQKLANNGNYELALKVLNVVEHNNFKSFSRLCTMLNALPDTILKLSPALFCRAIIALDPNNLKGIETNKCHIIALALLKSHDSYSAISLTLDLLSKTTNDLTEIFLRTVDYVLKHNDSDLKRKAFEIYKIKKLAMEATPMWMNDPSLVDKWLRGWNYSFALAKGLKNGKVQYCYDQIKAASEPGQALHSIIYGQLQDSKSRQQTLGSLINHALEFSSHDPEFLTQCGNLILKFENENTFENSEYWDDLERLMTVRYLLSQNFGLYMKACEYLITVFDRDDLKEKLPKILPLLESAILGLDEIKEQNSDYLAPLKKFHKLFECTRKHLSNNQKSKFDRVLNRSNLFSSLNNLTVTKSRKIRCFKYFNKLRKYINMECQKSPDCYIYAVVNLIMIPFIYRMQQKYQEIRIQKYLADPCNVVLRTRADYMIVGGAFFFILLNLFFLALTLKGSYVNLTSKRLQKDARKTDG